MGGDGAPRLVSLRTDVRSRGVRTEFVTAPVKSVAATWEDEPTLMDLVLPDVFVDHVDAELCVLRGKIQGGNLQGLGYIQGVPAAVHGLLKYTNVHFDLLIESDLNNNVTLCAPARCRAAPAELGKEASMVIGD